MRCSETAIIAVEIKVLANLLDFVGHLVCSLVHGDRLLVLDDLPQFFGLSGVFKFGGRPLKYILLYGVFGMLTAWLEHLECLVADVILVPFLEVMDAD